VSKLAAVVGMKSSRDMRVGESPSPRVRWLHSGCDREPLEKGGPALCCSTVDKVKCAAFR